MGKNDTLVLGIGLIVIIAITGFIGYGNVECFEAMTRAADASYALTVQQKDYVITRLFRQATVRQEEMNTLKAELDTTRTKLGILREEIANLAKVASAASAPAPATARAVKK